MKQPVSLLNRVLGAIETAGNALRKLLNRLSGEQTVSVIRAFTYFSLLANLAEDRHHIRRRAVHERAGSAQEGSIDVALQRLRAAGIGADTIAQTLAGSYVAPVLTPHPPEGQRKNILDTEREIAQLLTERDELRERAQLYAAGRDVLSPRQLAANEARLYARVSQLWQTRLLRYDRLTVADEIENALSYYESTFLTEIPRLYADLQAALGADQVQPRVDRAEVDVGSPGVSRDFATIAIADCRQVIFLCRGRAAVQVIRLRATHHAAPLVDPLRAGVALTLARHEHPRLPLPSNDPARDLAIRYDANLIGTVGLLRLDHMQAG